MLATDPAEAIGYLKDYDPLGSLTALTISDITAKQDSTVLIRFLKTLRQTIPDAWLEDNINTLGHSLMAETFFASGRSAPF